MLPECSCSRWTRIEYLDVFPHESKQQRLMRKDMEGNGRELGGMHMCARVVAAAERHGRQWEGRGGDPKASVGDLLMRLKDWEGSGTEG